MISNKSNRANKESMPLTSKTIGKKQKYRKHGDSYLELNFMSIEINVDERS